MRDLTSRLRALTEAIDENSLYVGTTTGGDPKYEVEYEDASSVYGLSRIVRTVLIHYKGDQDDFIEALRAVNRGKLPSNPDVPWGKGPFTRRQIERAVAGMLVEAINDHGAAPFIGKGGKHRFEDDLLQVVGHMLPAHAIIWKDLYLKKLHASMRRGKKPGIWLNFEFSVAGYTKSFTDVLAKLMEFGLAKKQWRAEVTRLGSYAFKRSFVQVPGKGRLHASGSKLVLRMPFEIRG